MNKHTRIATKANHHSVSGSDGKQRSLGTAGRLPATIKPPLRIAG